MPCFAQKIRLRIISSLVGIQTNVNSFRGIDCNLSGKYITCSILFRALNIQCLDSSSVKACVKYYLKVTILVSAVASLKLT